MTKTIEKKSFLERGGIWIFTSVVIVAMLIGSQIYSGFVYVADRNYEASLTPGERQQMADAAKLAAEEWKKSIDNVLSNPIFWVPCATLMGFMMGLFVGLFGGGRRY